MEDCIFCKISKGEVPCEKIYENDDFFSIPDAAPKAEGHSLVISKKHFETTLDLPDSLAQELLDCIKKTATKVMNENDADGFNVIANNLKSAGQLIDHTHFHIIPRRKGDGLKIIS